MQLANQASQLSLALSVTLFSKYGHFRFQKAKMAIAKIQTQGFKTAVHKPMDAMSNIYTVYGAKSSLIN